MGYRVSESEVIHEEFTHQNEHHHDHGHGHGDTDSSSGSEEDGLGEEAVGEIKKIFCCTAFKACLNRME